MREIIAAASIRLADNTKFTMCTYIYGYAEITVYAIPHNKKKKKKERRRNTFFKAYWKTFQGIVLQHY